MGLLESAIRNETPGARPPGRAGAAAGTASRSSARRTRDSIEEALAATAGGTRMTLNVAFNYSGRSEIVDAVRGASADGLAADEIDEAAIASRL